MRIIFLFLTLLFVACSQNKKQEVIKFGTSAQYPPFEYQNDKNEIVGFDIDLANEISKRINIKFTYSNISFDGLIPALKTGKIDAVISAMSATDERRKSVDFSKPYHKTKNAYLRRKDSNISKSELKNKKVSVELGSIQEIAAKKLSKNLSLTEDALSAILTLRANKADAVIIDEMVAKEYTKQYDDIEIFLKEDDGSEGMSIAFDKDKHKELIAKIDKSIDEIKRDGTMNKLLTKYKLR